MGPRRGSIWPSIYPRILDQILEHRSTIIFCNARRQAERLAAKLNELAEERGIGVDPDTGKLREELVRAHHGSLAREQRVIVEDELKRGDLRAIVATSSLELGIDMGAVDLVIQVESPGRGEPRPAAHRPGRPPGRRAEQGLDLPEAPRRPARGGGRREAHVRAARSSRRATCATRIDVLAQQVVAHVAARGELPVAEVAALVRRCANFAELSDEQLDQHARPAGRALPERGVLRAAAAGGVEPGQRHAPRPRRLEAAGGHVRRHDPRPRPVRRVPARRHARRRARRGDGLREPPRRDVRARRVDVADRGHHVREGHGHAGAGGAGEDAVLARRPAGPAARARAGARRVRARAARAAAGARPSTLLRGDYALDELAAANLVQYVDEQAEATGVVPDDRTIVVERFRDEIGDWRVCVLSPFGTPVHAPWAMAIERRLTDRYDLPVESMWGDDGIVLRLPEAADELPIDALLIEPEDIEELVVSTLPQTALFSSRFRECAGRALLLPRRRPDQRTPLWQQRQRAADLLAVAAKYPTFPILLEASRECLQDVFDVPALREVLGQLRSRSRARRQRRHATSRARWPRACCSTGSPPTCTRATPRSPSAGPPRWRSTATCCATCSAPRSCASCSIPGCSPTSSSTCSGCPTAGGPAVPTSCTTCCAASAT